MVTVGSVLVEYVVSLGVSTPAGAADTDLRRRQTTDAGTFEAENTHVALALDLNNHQRDRRLISYYMT